MPGDPSHFDSDDVVHPGPLLDYVSFDDVGPLGTPSEFFFPGFWRRGNLSGLCHVASDDLRRLQNFFHSNSDDPGTPLDHVTLDDVGPLGTSPEFFFRGFWWRGNRPGSCHVASDASGPLQNFSTSILMTYTFLEPFPIAAPQLFTNTSPQTAQTPVSPSAFLISPAAWSRIRFCSLAPTPIRPRPLCSPLPLISNGGAAPRTPLYIHILMFYRLFFESEFVLKKRATYHSERNFTAQIVMRL